MKQLLLIPIKIYWLIVPACNRKQCLFKESCSRHVYNKAIENGLWGGLVALVHRFQNCRPGYFVVEIEDEKGIITRNHNFYKENQLRENLI